MEKSERNRSEVLLRYLFICLNVDADFSFRSNWTDVCRSFSSSSTSVVQRSSSPSTGRVRLRLRFVRFVRLLLGSLSQIQISFLPTERQSVDRRLVQRAPSLAGVDQRDLLSRHRHFHLRLPEVFSSIFDFRRSTFVVF